MPFYIITGGNQADYWNKIEYFNDSNDLNNYLKKINKSEKPQYRKIETYENLILVHCDFDTDDKVLLIIKYVELKFGELLNKEFENQIPRTESQQNTFLTRIEQLQNELWDEAMALNEEPDYNERKSGWEDLGESEMKKWDRETGGSWRIENDFG